MIPVKLFEHKVCETHTYTSFMTPFQWTCAESAESVTACPSTATIPANGARLN